MGRTAENAQAHGHTPADREGAADTTRDTRETTRDAGDTTRDKTADTLPASETRTVEAATNETRTVEVPTHEPRTVEPPTNAVSSNGAGDAPGGRIGRQRIRLVRTAAELRATAAESERPGDGAASGRRGAALRAVVMTMGALHAGHTALVRAARERVGPQGQVVVTVFVNPLQFGPTEDLDRYPRTLDADLVMAEEAGADVVFAPSVAEVYPESAGPADGGGRKESTDVGPQVRIAAGPMGDRFEGAHRPGHFDGVLTVVAKLLHLTAPDIALYGQKDAQQLALIRRMVTDLNFPVEIVAVPTVREADGMALSSRNGYLSPEERRTGLALSRALFAARDTLPHIGARAALAAARKVLDEAAEAEPPLHVDYLALIDPSGFTEITDPGPVDRPDGPAAGTGTGRGTGTDAGTGVGPDADADAGADTDAGTDAGEAGEAVLAVAGRVGGTRLIDNVRLPLGVRR